MLRMVGDHSLATEDSSHRSLLGDPRTIGCLDRSNRSVFFICYSRGRRLICLYIQTEMFSTFNTAAEI